MFRAAATSIGMAASISLARIYVPISMVGRSATSSIGNGAIDEPRGAPLRCRGSLAGAAGPQRRQQFLELPRADRASRSGRRRVQGAWASPRRPRATVAGELQRVFRTAVRLLGGAAMRGAGECSAASARSRIHSREFGGPAAGRDAGVGRGVGTAWNFGGYARMGDRDPQQGL